MSTTEEEATSYEHEHSTYEAAPPALNELGEEPNPPSGPAVVQTRGMPVEATGTSKAKTGKEGTD